MLPFGKDREQVKRHARPSLQECYLQNIILTHERDHHTANGQSRTAKQRRQELLQILDMALKLSSFVDED